MEALGDLLEPTSTVVTNTGVSTLVAQEDNFNREQYELQGVQLHKAYEDILALERKLESTTQNATAWSNKASQLETETQSLKSELKAVHKNLASMKIHATMQAKKLNEITTTSETLLSEKKAAMSARSEKESEIATQARSLSAVQRENQELNQKLADASKALVCFEKSHRAVQTEKKVAETELAKAVEDLSTVKRERDELTKERALLVSKIESIHEGQQSLTSWKDALITAKKDNEALTAKLNEANEKVLQLEKKLQSAERTKAVSSKKVERLEKELSSNEEQIEALKQRASLAKWKASSVRKELNLLEENAAKNATHDGPTNRLEKANGHSGYNSVETKKRKHDETSSAFGSLTNTELESSTQLSQFLASQVSASEAALEALRIDNCGLKGRLVTAQADWTDLLAGLEALAESPETFPGPLGVTDQVNQAQMDDVDHNQRRIQGNNVMTLLKAKFDSELERRETRETLANFHRLLHEVMKACKRALEDELETLTKKCAALENEAATAAETLVSKETMYSAVADVKNELVTIRSQNDALREQLAGFHKENARMEVELRKKTEALLSLGSDLAAANKANYALKQTLDATKQAHAAECTKLVDAKKAAAKQLKDFRAKALEKAETMGRLLGAKNAEISTLRKELNARDGLATAELGALVHHQEISDNSAAALTPMDNYILIIAKAIYNAKIGPCEQYREACFAAFHQALTQLEMSHAVGEGIIKELKIRFSDRQVGNCWVTVIDKMRNKGLYSGDLAKDAQDLDRVNSQDSKTCICNPVMEAILKSARFARGQVENVVVTNLLPSPTIPPAPVPVVALAATGAPESCVIS